MNPLILSLCDLTGEWPRPYKEAGYDVIAVDIERGDDVRDFVAPRRAHGILAAPPCTLFSLAGNRHTRTPEQMHEALSIVDACLRQVALHKPKWWALENPKGKLIHYLGRPTDTFSPWEFGDGYTKLTYLWGEFATPVRSEWELKETYRDAGRDRFGYPEAYMPDSRYTRQQIRSITPAGFARAFFEANP